MSAVTNMVKISFKDMEPVYTYYPSGVSGQ